MTAVFFHSFALLKEVDDLHDEGLLIERIGVASVGILIAGSLQEADSGHVAGVHCSVEVINVVLVVGLVAIDADHAGRAWAQVLGIGSGGVVLEGLVVRDVVGLLNCR